ncbi:MAG: hypothetical protein JSS02_17285 [Planctomycetes bacterium]|nr:hypothetical protein [Planctomycetota bacterium]
MKYRFKMVGRLLQAATLWFPVSLTLISNSSLHAGVLVAQTGFNDQSGINSNPTVGSPYSLGNVTGQGGVEPGWLAPWGALSDSDTSLVQNSVIREGDQALKIVATSAPYRSLAMPTQTRLIVEQSVRFEEGARLVAYTELSTTGDSVLNQGAIWQAMPDHTIRVIDGDEDYCDTCGFEVVTNWEADVWYTVRIEVDLVQRTWDFYWDGILYAPADPLGFRGTPVMLDRVQYLSEGAGAVFLDAITMTAFDPVQVPAPSTLATLVAGMLVLCFRRGNANTSPHDRG